MTHVLVTGGAGYVGSHICKALALAGHTPVVYDNLSRGHRDAVRWGPLVEADINDKQALTAALSEHAIDSVVHCAALAYVAESVERPMDYYTNNVTGSVTLLEAMKESGVANFVFSSSCAVYGQPETVPIPESADIAPVSPYGRTKWMVEAMAKECARAYGMRTVALRYFNAAGADPDGDIGERHDPETHVIPLALQAAQDGTPFTIFGTDYDTPDGTAVRDYVHVADLADAHVRALDYAVSSEGHHAFNLGTGQGYSVREIVTAVERVTGKTLTVVESERRAGDPPALVAAASEAQFALGWQPKFSDLETIISHAWAFLTDADG